MSENNNTIHFCNEILKSKSRKEKSLHLCDRSLSEPKESTAKREKNGRRRSKSNSKVIKIFDRLKNGYQKAKLNLSVLNSSLATYKHPPLDSNLCCKSKAATNFKDYLIFGRTTIHDSSKNDRLDSFSLGNIIGRGSYGAVYNASSKNGQKYAIKLVLYAKLKQNIRFNSKKFKAKDVFLDDLKRFIDIKHPNILRLFSVFDSSNDDKIYLIFELAMR
uniref:Serine/threonine-protein kinase PLK4 (Trinotate prediction) n=1 Tax=Myxobolus squamalis TaxID=59785 RepID=A0A6B2G174_MYXSQ